MVLLGWRRGARRPEVVQQAEGLVVGEVDEQVHGVLVFRHLGLERFGPPPQRRMSLVFVAVAACAGGCRPPPRALSAQGPFAITLWRDRGG